MTLDVVFSPRELAAGEANDRLVVVIDVLRATSTICAALHHGARAIIPAIDTSDATRYAQMLDPTDVVLAGERQSVRIPGFALGNSPAEMTPDAVGGKLVVMTTTNGTGALLAAAGAAAVVVGAAVNATVVGEFARNALRDRDDLLIICAGRDQRFGLDDAYIAGCIAAAALGGPRRRKGLNDSAMACLDLVARYRDRTERVLTLSRAGRDLAQRGFRSDISAASQRDAHPVLPFFHERQVTLRDPRVAA